MVAAPRASATRRVLAARVVQIHGRLVPVRSLLRRERRAYRSVPCVSEEGNVKRSEIQLDECIHGMSWDVVRDAWEMEYQREREEQRSEAVSCSCCMGPSYGSYICPSCSRVEGS